MNPQFNHLTHRKQATRTASYAIWDHNNWGPQVSTGGSLNTRLITAPTIAITMSIGPWFSAWINIQFLSGSESEVKIEPSILVDTENFPPGLWTAPVQLWIPSNFLLYIWNLASCRHCFETCKYPKKSMLLKHGSSVFHLFIIPTEYTHKNKVINIKAYVMKKSLQGPCHERSLDAHLLWSMSLPISQLTHPPARGGRTTSWNLKKHHQRAWLTFYHHHHHHYDAYHHCRHWENTTIEVFAHVEKLGSFLSYFRRLRIINVFH